MYSGREKGDGTQAKKGKEYQVESRVLRVVKRAQKWKGTLYRG